MNKRVSGITQGRGVGTFVTKAGVIFITTERRFGALIVYGLNVSCFQVILDMARYRTIPHTLTALEGSRAAYGNLAQSRAISGRVRYLEGPQGFCQSAGVAKCPCPFDTPSPRAFLVECDIRHNVTNVTHGQTGPGWAGVLFLGQRAGWRRNGRGGWMKRARGTGWPGVAEGVGGGGGYAPRVPQRV